MPKRIAPLSDVQIKNAKTKEKESKLYDGGGLYLVITPSGGKLWRLKYQFDGKEKLLSLGAYPAIALADARRHREDAKKLIASGSDPGEVKKATRIARRSASENSFEHVARRWQAIMVPRWSETHAKTTLSRLERDVIPWLGSKPIEEVKLTDVKSVLHRIEARTPESARRIWVTLTMIFRYCVADGMIERSPLEGLKPRDVLTTEPMGGHFPAITDPKELAVLLRLVDGYKGSHVVKCALQLAPLTFQRPSDLRMMEWEEISFNEAEWNIPIEKMKLTKKEKIKRQGELHCVPLSVQALNILRDLHPLTGHSRYVFPGYRTHLKPLSEAALTAALHRLGYKDIMSWHGFRATARTILDEVLGFRPDYIEHQLAHAVRDTLGRAYNRTTHLPERKKMLQTWSDYLEEIKSNGQVIPFRAKAG